MIVMKFGGTSVQNSEAVRRLLAIVGERVSQKPVVVVSALSGVTDTLIKIAHLTSKGEVEQAIALTKSLEERHLKMADELMSNNALLLNETKEVVIQLFAKLTEVVKVISILEELSDMSMARIVSYGEILSSNIIFRAMKSAGMRVAFADARSFMITDTVYLKGEPQTEIICKRVPELLNREYHNSDIIITQGFISATVDGVGTTLGRGGSDYTAALIGMAAGASEIEI
ncbi:hypothetical protein MASR2M69_02750 [Bacteroidota bacterium]